MKRIISLALCFLLVFALCQPAFAAGKGYEWTGASDNNWHTAENWIPEGVPESGDFVTIPTSAVVECDLGEEGGTLSLYLTCAGELTFPNGTLELHNSTLTGGKLSGAGTIVVTAIGQFQWTGGSIEGPGELHVQQGIFSVKPSAYLDRKLVLYGVNGKVLLSDSLTLAGGAEVGDISNNTITIHAGQTLELTGDNTTYSLVNCNNSGTLRISNTCQSVVFDGDFTQQQHRHAGV